jgi:hypothetical protein
MLIAPITLTRAISATTNWTDLAWAAVITQVWADDLTDSRQDLYTPQDGHPTDGGDARPPLPERTENDSRR